jgi:predicted ATP-grasp superfamily ATP-dependent carboligase
VEVIQSLGSRGIPIDVASEHEHAAGFRSRYTMESLQQPSSPAYLAEWLNDLVSRKDYALLVPATENSLQAFRAVGGRDTLWKRAVLPPQASLETALDKQKTWILAEGIGVPVPRSRLIEQGEPIPSAEVFPAVLKPMYSVVTIGKQTCRLEPKIVRTEEERNRHLGELLAHTSVQEQQYVEGIGVGVECLYANGKLIWSFVHERVHELPLTGGASTYRKSIAPDVELVSAAEKLLNALAGMAWPWWNSSARRTVRCISWRSTPGCGARWHWPSTPGSISHGACG